jgi:hypothetical protein
MVIQCALHDDGAITLVERDPAPPQLALAAAVSIFWRVHLEEDTSGSRLRSVSQSLAHARNDAASYSRVPGLSGDRKILQECNGVSLKRQND